MHPSDARQLARALMNQHGLAHWRFDFDHARRRFGSCRPRDKTITLSRPLTLLNPESQVRDTLLHEIAHALTPGDSHGAKWRAKCVELGASPQRCYSEVEVKSPPRAPAPYRYGCPPCNWWVDRRRLNSKSHRYICRHCRGPLMYVHKPTNTAFRISPAGVLTPLQQSSSEPSLF